MTASLSHPWLEHKQVGGTTVVTFTQENLLHDEEIGCVGEYLRDLVENRGVRQLVLNFGPVKFLSSEMFGELLVLFRRLRALDGRLGLCQFTPHLRQALAVLGLHQVFAIYDTEQEAVAGVSR